MNEQSCRQIGDLLVDFADDELTGAQRTMVADHLGECPACRREVKLLETSLRHAQQAWQESTCERRPARVDSPTSRRKSKTAYWAVASLALVAAALSAWAAIRLDSLRLPASSQPPVAGVAPTSPNSSDLAMSEIDAMLAKESRAARLAASAEMLSSVPSLDRYSNQAEQYIAANYATARAGRRLQDRLNQLDTPTESDTDR